MDRNETIAAIRSALKRRSGKTWSVTGGSGTAWGWITIQSPPARRTWQHRLKAGATGYEPGDYEPYDAGTPGHSMSPSDQQELAALMGLDRPVGQYISIPSDNAYYREHLDRAEGRTPTVIGRPYWD